MADEENVLLDTFVRVLPHPDNDDVVAAAVAKTKAMFAAIGSASVGPGGTRATDDLKQGFIDAKRYADDLARQAGITARAVKSIGDEDVSAGFRTAIDQLKKARQELRESSQEKDPLGLEKGLEKANRSLDVVAEKLRAIRGGPLKDLSQIGDNRDQFRSLVETERQRRSEFNIDTGFNRQFDKGQSFAEKFRFAELIRDVKSAEAAFDSLQRTFRQTGTTAASQAIQLQKMGEAAENLTNARQHVADTFRNRTPGTQSTNALSNNAYQLGQAIEDASVGFQLNGFQGAVRGAANNIAFILNDLSRMPNVQNLIGQRFANMLPLVAGIGSAVAILVLPKLIEWLQSLNDIEAGFRDITKEIENAFEGRDFQIKTGLENDGLRKSIADATSLKDVLEKIRQLSDQNASREKELKGIFSGFNNKELGLDQFTPLENINDQFARLEFTIKKSSEEAQKFDRTLNLYRRPFNQIFGFGPSFTEDVATAAGVDTTKVTIAKLQELKQQEFAVRSIINDTVQKAQEGVATPETFIRAQRQIDDFRASLKKNIGSLELGKEQKEILGTAFEGFLGAIEKDFKKGEELSRQTAENIGQQFEIAFAGAVNKVAELKTQLKLLDQISQGKNTRFDSKLLEVGEEIDKGRLLVIEALDARRKEAEKNNIAINEQGMSAIRDRFELETQVNLKLLLQEEKLLEAKKKRSQFTQFEDFAKKLQTNVLSGSDEEDRRENIRRWEQVIERNAQQRRFADVAMESRVPPTPQEQAVAFEQALRVLMPPLFQLIDGQNKTTEAVKKVPGAVAQ